MTETELEAQVAELKQEKDRLLGLLEKALTALSQWEERDAKRLPAHPTSTGARPTVKAPPEEIPPGTWAALKNWFLNA